MSVSNNFCLNSRNKFIVNHKIIHSKQYVLCNLFSYIQHDQKPHKIYLLLVAKVADININYTQDKFGGHI